MRASRFSGVPIAGYKNVRAEYAFQGGIVAWYSARIEIDALGTSTYVLAGSAEAQATISISPTP